MRSLVWYFRVYFTRCLITREINREITISIGPTDFATRVHTLVYIQCQGRCPHSFNRHNNGVHFSIVWIHVSRRFMYGRVHLTFIGCHFPHHPSKLGSISLSISTINAGISLAVPFSGESWKMALGRIFYVYANFFKWRKVLECINKWPNWHILYCIGRASDV